MSKANASGFVSILPVHIATDAKAPTRYTVMAVTGGLGLPDRDYYLQPSFATQKAKYEEYVAKIVDVSEKFAQRKRSFKAFTPLPYKWTHAG